MHRFLEGARGRVDTRYVDAFPRYAYRSFLEVSSLLRDAGSSKLTATLGHVRNNRGTRDTRLACPSDSSSSLPPPLRPETISSPSLLNRTRFYISILYIYIYGIYSTFLYSTFLIYSIYSSLYILHFLIIIIIIIMRDEAPCSSSVKRGREREGGGGLASWIDLVSRLARQSDRRDRTVRVVFKPLVDEQWLF